ncbi:hypothetical protein ACLOJK_021563 [Asimina triloba]
MFLSSGILEAQVLHIIQRFNTSIEHPSKNKVKKKKKTRDVLSRFRAMSDFSGLAVDLMVPGLSISQAIFRVGDPSIYMNWYLLIGIRSRYFPPRSLSNPCSMDEENPKRKLQGLAGVIACLGVSCRIFSCNRITEFDLDDASPSASLQQMG